MITKYKVVSQVLYLLVLHNNLLSLYCDSHMSIHMKPKLTELRLHQMWHILKYKCCLYSYLLINRLPKNNYGIQLNIIL